jgi:hypothetical protein
VASTRDVVVSSCTTLQASRRLSEF